MSELVGIAELILTSSQRRQEIAASNIANLETPGFRASISFSEVIESSAARAAFWSSNDPVESSLDTSDGGLKATGQSLDLAISGAGFFHLEGTDASFLTRDGRFQIDGDGRVVSADGLRLQTDNGGDLFVESEAVEIRPDGIVLEAGLPIARVGVFQPTDINELEAMSGSLFRLADTAPPLEPVTNPVLRQGMLEGANVDLTTQMLDIVATQRQMEVGAQLVRTYDTLMGQAISTFGRGRR